MTTNVSNWFDLADLLHTFKRQVPVVLVNGLAEQPESWFANRSALSRHFDVKVPEILVYDGDPLHKRIDSGGEITVGYLADRLCQFLDEFVQRHRVTWWPRAWAARLHWKSPCGVRKAFPGSC